MSELDSLVIVHALWKEAQMVHRLYCLLDRAESDTVELLGCDHPRDGEFCNWVLTQLDILAASNECHCTNCRCECRNCQSWQAEYPNADRDEERMAWA